jgi:regulatory protein
LPPLDEGKLNELALRYVGKYATTRAKLREYLARKVRERGWAGPRQANFEGIADRFAELGYIDDAAYALTKSRSLAARGYGKRRLNEKLRSAGIEEEDARAARQVADEEAVAAALRFAQRRRIGPFSTTPADPNTRQKAIAAMARAGHPLGLAQAIAALPPSAELDTDDLQSSLTYFSG